MPTDLRLRSNLKTIGLASFALISLIAAEPSSAEIKTITATGEYRMGDNDTRTDAKRLALLDAKRLALEQAGTYLESVTEIKNLQVSRDELNAYTAGIVEVTELETKDVLDGATHVIRVHVTAKIDADVVAHQIDALRKNESARAELIRLRIDAERLRRELETRTRELVALKSKDEVETVTIQRQKVLNAENVNELLTRAIAMPFGERTSAIKLVDQALALNPTNPLAHAYMGILLLGMNKGEAAAREFQTAIHLQPDDARHHYALGSAFDLIGNVDGAIAQYRIVVRLDPGDADAHMRLGLALAKGGKFADAIAEYRMALRPAP